MLYQDKSTWPDSPTALKDTCEEMIHNTLKITMLNKIIDETRFSKWKRLLRTTAYFLRFVDYIKSLKIEKGEFAQEELVNASNFLMRQAQQKKYFHELSCLRTGESIPKSSEIYKKSPFIDLSGVLRVDGRIDKAKIPEEQKNPIILPKSSYITNLLIMDYHIKYHHMNHETAVNEIRQQYSINKLRTAYKHVTRNCQWCKVYKVKPNVPLMAKLPRARLASFESPFSYTGLDFFGPLMVTVGRHKEKRYGCLFTCLTMRAVHIELGHSLNTSSCILAIRNFMARRGIPREFFSDNGTNFVGAERELREALNDVDKNAFVREFTTTTTKWNFNPPSSPHMGGAWERLVRSIKTVLYKITPSRAPSDEVLFSNLIEVENIINSRPLAYVPIGDEVEEAITPNHFLVGSSNGLKPMSMCDDSGVVLRQSWLISQQYANMFWKKWLAEYLPSLTCRSKWFERHAPLRKGDLVVIVDPFFPRNVWPRGKVLETRLAKDGQVRSAKVLTATGILERPVAKLAVLDVASQKSYAGDDSPCHTGGRMLPPPAKLLFSV
ncbi:uncharacterized protein [Musca autumnalis]|uniref:uncharacterized protein n=1 Tax=Musca autumnalis TaxID=221902 RepID=UPI003CF00E22